MKIKIVEFVQIFYAILCVKFVREVQYSTSEMAIISLSLVKFRAMNLRRAARIKKRSTEEWGEEGITEEERAARVASK